MTANRETILKKLMTNYGLFENMFWKYGDNILYNTEKEMAKRFLIKVYGKTDVNILFPEEIDREDYEKTLNTIFTYYDGLNERNDKDTK